MGEKMNHLEKKEQKVIEEKIGEKTGEKEPEYQIHEVTWASDQADYHETHTVQMKIVHCVKGSGKIRQDHTVYEYGPGTYLIIPAGMDYYVSGSAVSETKWEYVWVDQDKIIHMFYPYNQSFIQKYDSDSFHRILSLNQEHPELSHIKVILELVFREIREKEILHIDNISGLLQILFVYLFRDHRGLSDLQTKVMEYCYGFDAIYPAIRYMQDHYQENIDVKALANLCNMSVSYMRKKFTNYVHMGPQEFIVRIRIKKACEMMLTSTRSIEDIAYLVGFQSKSSFYRNFNHYVGCSPLRWKENKLKEG